MEHITPDELNADLNTIFDRVNRNHEIFSVIRDKNQAIVILDARDYIRLTKQTHLAFPGEISQVRKDDETFSPDSKSSDALILSALYGGRITESCDLVQNRKDTEKPHPLSEAIGRATDIMKRHNLTDRDIGKACRILSDLLDEHGIAIQSADFSIKTYKGDEWIHYDYHLGMSSPELLPGLETELNLRLSSLPSEIFEALEIDITANGADSLVMIGDISEVIAANDALMQRINQGRQEMREGIPSLSYEEVFGE